VQVSDLSQSNVVDCGRSGCCTLLLHWVELTRLELVTPACKLLAARSARVITADHWSMTVMPSWPRFRLIRVIFSASHWSAGMARSCSSRAWRLIVYSDDTTGTATRRCRIRPERPVAFSYTIRFSVAFKFSRCRVQGTNDMFS